MCCISDSICELFGIQFTIFLGVVVKLVLNVMEVLSVCGGALLDRLFLGTGYRHFLTDAIIFSLGLVFPLEPV